MRPRQLVVLGTASQAPTRTRNQNGYLLRWDAHAVLFDPGEGTQRQLLLAGESTGRISHICLTHFHGDHVLGLPGVLHRMALEQVTHPVHLLFPASGAHLVDRLRGGTAYAAEVDVRLHPLPVDRPVEVATDAGYTIHAAPLDHRVDALGYRIQEPAGRRMLPERLAAAGVEGQDIGRLIAQGRLRVADGRTVDVHDVSAPRAGQAVAVVMDTRPCAAATELARGVDLLLAESTFLHPEVAMAERYRHMTAAQAGRLAEDAGARRLVLTHYSQRYPEESAFQAEAAAVTAADVIAARDLDRIDIPGRVDA